MDNGLKEGYMYAWNMHGTKMWNLGIAFPVNFAFMWKIFAILRGNLSFRWIFGSFTYNKF